MPITKDSKKLYMKNGNLPVSVINGLASLIETGSTIKTVNLPNDYDDNRFPSHSREEEVKGSVVSLLTNSKNNSDHLLFSSGQYATFNVHPNVEPFNRFNSFKVETLGNGNSVTFQIFNKNNEKLYENTKSSSGSAVDGWFINWDLTSLELGLEELVFKLIANTNNMAISGVFFEYDLKSNDAENIFKQIAKQDSLDNLNTTLSKIKGIQSGVLSYNCEANITHTFQPTFPKTVTEGSPTVVAIPNYYSRQIAVTNTSSTGFTLQIRSDSAVTVYVHWIMVPR